MNPEEQKQHAPPPEEKNPKRRMKTPSQLELLEKVYAEEKYPSEAVRAGLSSQLELSDRQLQMWFCHRRLKDRKVKEDESTTASIKQPLINEKEPAVATESTACKPSVSPPEIIDSAFLSRNNCNNSFTAGKQSAKDTEMIPLKKGHQVAPPMILDPQRALELQLIASVEAQLGEPLREDGPTLGLEFDPLPPGAFGTPIAPVYPRHAAPQPPTFQYESKSPEWQEIKYHKKVSLDHRSSGHAGGKRKKGTSWSLPGVTAAVQPTSRGVREYQFIPEQPTTGRAENNQTYERSNPAKLYSGIDNPYESVPSTSSFLHGNDGLNLAFSYQGRALNTCGHTLAQTEDQNNHANHRNEVSFDGFKDPFVGYSSSDGKFGSHQALLPLSPGPSFISPDRMAMLHEQEQLRLERKRKVEEARTSKEVEAHEKRIKREIEKQEIARKKREEQLSKELEKQSREKQREFERVLREKQREEERIQREQKREIERRDKLMQKESTRIERQQKKDEIRRQKEAAKMKAALERAAARRMAREYVELIDDERLELLEAAAGCQGLPSIYLLDGETLQGLDRYQGILKRFPPASVKMKKPIAAHPWIESTQNVNKLLMAWRFITTFADVLGLWPFTVDEFAQAFHDYDPRLLGEVHIALLRTVLKDIDDVTHTSVNGAVANQHTLSFTGGGHPQLVESAFAWGFDISEWHQYLNPLTWPEILRQFALSSGYGPKWKKQKPEIEHLSEENEVNNGEEAVNTLRSGSAVANAVTQMRGKGAHGRRNRNRLTPGTVKYAAFHVLATVGSKGLSIAEIAERIQESGLRDLSTSRTPEASITAALSRDTLLFERIAPSTYCVRPVYRKNPEDAEILLEAARERMRAFQNEAEDGEKDMEDADEIEREEDYDDDDDVETYDVGEAFTVVKTPHLPHLPCIEKERIQTEQLNGEIGNQSKPIAANETKVDKQSLDISANAENCLINFEKTQIDEGHMGETWVQGLMEGEYSDLSVDERLNALVALIDLVNEGNTIRVALEERLEAANALKRQLWMEAQIDKRRSKEEQLMKFHFQAAGDENKNEQGNPSTNEDHENAVEKVSEGFKLDNDHCADQAQPLSQSAQAITPNMQGASGQDIFISAQVGLPYEKSRAQMKAEIGLHAEELFVYRSLPLGSDRRHNRYWIFSTSSSGEDPGCGRLYVEFSEDGHWEIIDTEEALEALMTSLDTRGIREANLHNVLQNYDSNLRRGMKRMFSVDGGTIAAGSDSLQYSGAISIESGYYEAERQHGVERYDEFDKWLWKTCSRKGPFCLKALKLGKRRSYKLLSLCDVCHDLYSPKDKHCPCCHATFEWLPKLEAKFSHHLLDCEGKRKREDSNWKPQGPAKLLPSRIQFLKAELVSLEALIPAEALKSTWTESKRKIWAASLKKLVSSRELLQALTDLESAINRGWLSSLYETSKDLLNLAFPEDNPLSSSSPDGAIPLPWVPRSTAAVALRLRMFDAALFYSSEQKQQKLKQTEANTAKDEAVATAKMQETKSEEENSVGEETKVDAILLDSPGGQHSGRGRGRAGRPRGRGRGRSDNGRIVAEAASTLKVSRRKLKFLDGNIDSIKQTDGRKRGRGRARGRGRGRGRASGIGRGRGRGRGRGCGRGRGSNTIRCQQNEYELNRGETSGSQKKNNTLEPARLDERSEGSSQNEAWEGQDYEDGDNNNGQHRYTNETSTSEDAEDEPDEVEQVIEDEPEEEYLGQYEEDNARDEESGEDEASVEEEEGQEIDEELEEYNDDDDDAEAGVEGSMEVSESESFEEID